MNNFDALMNKLIHFEYSDMEEYSRDISEMDSVFGNTEFCQSEMFLQIKEDFLYRKALLSLENSSDEILIMILKNDVKNNKWSDVTEAAYSILFERFPGKRVDDFLE